MLIEISLELRVSTLDTVESGSLSKLVIKAMFGGALASWLTATIAGILI